MMATKEAATSSPKYCLSCSYVLDGLVSRRCPECGHPFDPANPETFARSGRQPIQRKWAHRSLILAAILLPIELVCVGIAYETIGEVLQGALILMFLGGNLIGFLLLLFRLPRAAMVWLLFFALLIIPHQSWLGLRLAMLRYEAGQLVAYLEQTKKATGEYPPDLSGYTFRFPSLDDHFHHYAPSSTQGGFEVRWHVNTRGIAHWYSPRDGWSYYPD